VRYKQTNKQIFYHGGKFSTAGSFPGSLQGHEHPNFITLCLISSFARCNPSSKVTFLQIPEVFTIAFFWRIGRRFKPGLELRNRNFDENIEKVKLVLKGFSISKPDLPSKSFFLFKVVDRWKESRKFPNWTSGFKKNRFYWTAWQNFIPI